MQKQKKARYMKTLGGILNSVYCEHVCCFSFSKLIHILTPKKKEKGNGQ